jgi:K+-transporting ATPase KdpF subunit
MKLTRYWRQNSNGHHLHRHSYRILSPDLGTDEVMRRSWRTKKGGQFMSWLYVISGLISLGLLVYLFAALLKPEIFE